MRVSFLLLIVIAQCCFGYKLAITTTNDVLFDGTFIEAAYNAAQTLVATGNWQLTVIYANTSNYESKITETLSADSYDLIVTFSFQQADVTAKLGPIFNNTKWLLIDFSFATYPPNVQGVVYRNDQLGFLGGVVAGLITQTKKIGMVSGIAFNTLLDINAGAKEGIHLVCPDCLTWVDYTGTFTNSGGFTTSVNVGEVSAQRLIDLGCDVIMGAGGLTGSAGIFYAAERGVWVTGVDADQYYGYFKNQSTNITQFLLTSWLKGVGVAVTRAAQSIENNIFQSGTILLDVASGGVGLAPCHDACAFFTAEDTIRKNEVLNQLSTGALQTGINGDSTFSHTTDAGNNTFVLIRPFNDIPSPVTGQSAMMVGTTMYIFGGFSKGVLANNVYDFSYDREIWTFHNVSGVAPEARQNPALVNYKNNIYIFGGRFANQSLTDEIWTYNVSQNSYLVGPFPPFTWTKIIPVGASPGPREGQKAFVFEDKMYVFQGETDQGIDASLWTFDFISLSWSKVVPASSVAPPPLKEFCVADDSNGTFFVFGGFTLGAGGSTILTNDLWRYSVLTNEWTLMPVNGATQPLAVKSCSAGWATSRVVIYGGVSGSIFSETVYIYDVRKMTWEGLNIDASYPPGRLGHTMTYYNLTDYHREQFIVFGGSLQGTLDSSVYIFTLPALVPLPITTWMDCNLNILFDDPTGTVVFNRSIGIFPESYYCDGYVDCQDAWDEGFQCASSLQALWVAFGVIGILVLLFLFILAVLLVRYLDHPIIKASTPLFLGFILIGGVIGTWSIFTFMQIPTPIRCGSLWWLLGFGFVLIMGSIVVKNFRIYLIFSRAEKLVSFTMKETELCLYLFIVLLIDLIILAVWTGVPSNNPYQIVLTPEPNNPLKEHEVCSDQLENPCLWVFIIYQGLIVVASAVIAFKTRSVEKRYQESKYITLAIYSYLIVALVILPILMLGLSTPLASYTVAMVAIILAVCIPIVMLFLPKLRNIWYPKEPKPDSSSSSGITVDPASIRKAQGTGSDVLSLKSKAKTETGTVD